MNVKGQNVSGFDPANFDFKQYRIMKIGNFFFSCSICRDKKIRCDGVRPICGNCSRYDKFCNYEENYSNHDLLKDFDKVGNKLYNISNVIEKIKSPITDFEQKVNEFRPYPHKNEVENSKNFQKLQIETPIKYSVDTFIQSSGKVKKAKCTIISKTRLETEFADTEDSVISSLIDKIFCKNIFSYILCKKDILLRLKSNSLPSYMKLSILSFGAKHFNIPNIFQNHIYMRGSAYAKKALLEILSDQNKVNLDKIFSLILISTHYSGVCKTHQSNSLLTTSIK
ncbi:hypothetical protein AYI70_g3569 [Smittium culicis]|uniref:Zn(2)-C6 fungal-type domain-containing protein n=1 Tax=Smittium culicis TaxID=133412 RepID=A0A1R1Y2U2_9FUNG|nr:hypothetical protein AYI70_g3569 [Smittium culicis]